MCLLKCVSGAWHELRAGARGPLGPSASPVSFLAFRAPSPAAPAASFRLLMPTGIGPPAADAQVSFPPFFCAFRTFVSWSVPVTLVEIKMTVISGVGEGLPSWSSGGTPRLQRRGLGLSSLGQGTKIPHATSQK